MIHAITWSFVLTSGAGHVFLRADRVDDLRHVAAGERLELAAGHARGVADDAALAAAERDVRHGALPGHPGGERRDFVEADVGMVANPTLGRPERDVVLHAIPREDFDLAVVHLNRTRDDDLALGVREDLPDTGVEPQQSRRSIELLEHGVEDAAAAFHGLSLDCGHRRQAGPPKTQTDQGTLIETGKSRKAQGSWLRAYGRSPRVLSKVLPEP